MLGIVFERSKYVGRERERERERERAFRKYTAVRLIALTAANRRRALKNGRITLIRSHPSLGYSRLLWLHTRSIVQYRWRYISCPSRHVSLSLSLSLCPSPSAPPVSAPHPCSRGCYRLAASDLEGVFGAKGWVRTGAAPQQPSGPERRNLAGTPQVFPTRLSESIQQQFNTSQRCVRSPLHDVAISRQL